MSCRADGRWGSLPQSSHTTVICICSPATAMRSGKRESTLSTYPLRLRSTAMAVQCEAPSLPAAFTHRRSCSRTTWSTKRSKRALPLCGP